MSDSDTLTGRPRREPETDTVRTSEIRYRRLFETARDGILMLDAVTRQITDVNPFMVELLGYSRAEFLGKELFEIGLLQDAVASAEAFRELQDSGYIRYEDLPLQTKGGQRREVEFVSNVYAENGHQVIQCNIRDITARKRDERDLARLAAIVESSQDAIITKTLDGVITTWNAGAQTLYGYTAEEAIGRPVSFLAPADLPDEMPQLLESIRRGESVQYYETVRVRKDGSRFDISLSISPLRDTAGHIIGASSIKRDITERKRAEAALRESEARYRSIFDNTVEGIYQADPAGRCTVANPALAQMLAYGSPAELQSALTATGHLPYVDGERHAALALQLEQHGEVAGFESQVYCKNRAMIWIAEATRAVRDPRGRLLHYQGIVRDITARIQMQQTVRMRPLLAAASLLVVLGTAASEWLQYKLTPSFGPLGAGVVDVVLTSLVATTGIYFALQKQGASHRHTLDEMTERQRAEVALHESEERFLQMAENTSEVFWMADAHSQETLYLSPAYETVWGRTRQSAYERPLTFTEAVHPDDREHLLAVLQEKLILGAFNEEYRIVRPDGSVRWIWDRASPIRNEQGEIYRVVGVAQDITERKQAEAALQRAHDELEMRVTERTAALERANVALRDEEIQQLQIMATLAQSEERFRLLVESVHDYAILMLDTTGHIMTWNAGAEHLKGYQAAEIIGHHFSCFYTAEDQQAGKPEQELHAAATQGYLDDEGWRVRQDGSRFWATTVITALRDDSGQLRGFAKITRDITERKNIEAALHEAKAQADTANLAKSEFLSRMSHELRTPLNAILGFGQLLANQDFAPAQQERVQHILKAGRHLLDLINEVLDIARIEAGHIMLSMEPVLVRETVQEVFALMRPLAAERGIELHGSEAADLELYVQADRQRLKQVLLNLCSNAIKYNRAQGTVTITCETVPGVTSTAGQAVLEGLVAEGPVAEGPVRSDQLRISVTDTGMGIAAASQTQLFVPFMRVGAEQTSIEGTGLGLALSLSLIHAMGGTIGVASTVGVGSTFWLQLPLAPAPILPASAILVPAAAAPTVNGTRYSLLYIEDNLSNLQLIEAILADQPHYELLSAMQGQVGLDLARQHHPDLILLDLHLPDVPGDQVLARLKADPITVGIPVVMLSAVAMEREIQRLLAAGASAYLTKPLDVQQFLDTLANVLRSSERKG